MQAAKSPFCAVKSFSGQEIDGFKFKFKMPVFSKRPPFNRLPVSLSKKDSVFNGLQVLKNTADKFSQHWFSGDENSHSGNSVEHSGDVPSSPKQMLGVKWPDYAGRNDWKGLLDPLDGNLRREIVKYGELVQAAYTACDFDPQSKTYGQCKYSEESLLSDVGVQGTGYRVTQHIHSTSAIEVPQWLTSIVSSLSQCDATWMLRRTSWIGYVAVCEDDVEAARLGRRDIVVAFRGTVTPLEWLENLRDILTPVMSTSWTGSLPASKVQTGFWNLYTCRDPNGRSASADVLDEVERLVKLYAGEEISITVTGHSLGAALALLTAYQVGAAGFRCRNHRPVPVSVFSFGGPRVGNGAFRRCLEEMGVKILRLVNTQDIITKVPGVVLEFPGSWISRYLDFWCYRHVGTELRVSNKNSPYLKREADMACCHDLEAYLHLIDGFFSSSVPFRKNAKRDILRLLVNQKSDVLLKAAAGKKSGENRRREASI